MQISGSTGSDAALLLGYIVSVLFAAICWQ